MVLEARVFDTKEVSGPGGHIVDCYPYGFCASTPEEGVTSRLRIADPVELRSEDFEDSIVFAAHVSPGDAVGRGLRGLIVADMTPWPTYHSLHSAYVGRGLAPHPFRFPCPTPTRS